MYNSCKKCNLENQKQELMSFVSKLDHKFQNLFDKYFCGEFLSTKFIVETDILNLRDEIEKLECEC